MHQVPAKIYNLRLFLEILLFFLITWKKQHENREYSKALNSKSYSSGDIFIY